MSKVYKYDEVVKHNTPESCWVILYGKVYDVSDFLPQHPGGSKIILQLAGQDATEEYDPIHPAGTLEENLSPSALLGTIDASTLPSKAVSTTKKTSKKPPKPSTLEEMLNVDDIEAAATEILSPQAWAYYYSGGADLISKHMNSSVYQRILLRPRVFVEITQHDTTTSILGHPVRLPIHVSPAAMARLAHNDGEAGIARACATYGVPQIISNHASLTPEEIVREAHPEQVFGWQIYVQTDRRRSEAMLQRIAKLPNIKFVVLTLDAPIAGKREDDERQKYVPSNIPIRSAVQQQKDNPLSTTSSPSSTKSVGQSLFQGTALDLTWSTTLPWLAEHTKLPIVIKGIQSHEDAALAAQYTPQVKGIIISNHGGRSLDTVPPPIYTLLEVRKYCPHVLSKLEVWVDGGIKRGTDVVKALALGAKSVGMGRAPLFALTLGGQVGVERLFAIMKAEIEIAMGLMGVQRLEQIGLEHVNTRAVERDIYDGPSNLGITGRLWSKL